MFPHFGPYPYAPFDKPLQPPGGEPEESPLVCVQFSRAWLPYVLGCLPALTAGKTWQGTAEEIALAQKRSENLIGLFQGETCAMITDIRINGCHLEVQYGELGWIDLGDLTLCSTPGPQGPQGPPGVDGTDGTDGTNGIDGTDGTNGSDGTNGIDGTDGTNGSDGTQGIQGEVGPIGPIGPIGPAGREGVDTPPAYLSPSETHNENVCALALGTADFIVDKAISGLKVIQASVLAGRDILDQVTDFLDFIPVIGPLVNNVTDLVVSMATKGDFDDVIGFWLDPDFPLGVAEQLYCVFKRYSTIDASIIREGMQAVMTWSGSLPPGMPLITLYGQIFVLFMAVLDENYVYKRTYIYQNNLSDDCVPFDLCHDFCYKFDFKTGQHGWEIVLQGGANSGGSYHEGVGFVGDTQPSGTFQRLSIGLQHSLNGSTLFELELNGHNPATFASVYIQGHGFGIIAQGNDGTITGDFHRVFGNINLSDDNMDYLVLDTPAGQPIILESVIYRGYGYDPFGQDNCMA